MSTLLLQFLRGFGFIAGVLFIAFIISYIPRLLGRLADYGTGAVSSDKQIIQNLKFVQYEQEKEKVKRKEGEATYNQIYF
jgi:hypothetical protein